MTHGIMITNMPMPDFNTTENKPSARRTPLRLKMYRKSCYVMKKLILHQFCKFKVIWKLRKFFQNKYLNVLFINFAWQLFVEIVKKC